MCRPHGRLPRLHFLVFCVCFVPFRLFCQAPLVFYGPDDSDDSTRNLSASSGPATTVTTTAKRRPKKRKAGSLTTVPSKIMTTTTPRRVNRVASTSMASTPTADVPNGRTETAFGEGDTFASLGEDGGVGGDDTVGAAQRGRGHQGGSSVASMCAVGTGAGSDGRAGVGGERGAEGQRGDKRRGAGGDGRRTSEGSLRGSGAQQGLGVEKPAEVLNGDGSGKDEVCGTLGGRFWWIMWWWFDLEL